MIRKKPVPDAPAEEQDVQVETSVEPKNRAGPENADDILTINDQERGITPQDSDDVKWNYINGAYVKHMILTGVVSGIENLDSENPLVAVDYEGVQVIIPGRQMFLYDWPSGEKVPKNIRMRLGRMLGATVDFALTSVSIRSRLAFGSRKMAMLNRQSKYYRTERVKPGIRIACRVIGVGNNYLSVEAIGVDTDIEASRLSWEWFSDVNDLYSVGDLIVARVVSVYRDPDTWHYKVRLSVKEATANPDLPSLKKLMPGSSYFGVVTGVRDGLIFVRLQAGANAKTKLYHTKQIPSKLDTVSFQVRKVDEESGVALGLITRIIKRHARLR